jgi:hypothetical protein
MVLLGDEAPVEAHYGPFGIVLILRHDWKLKNRFGRTRWYS